MNKIIWHSGPPPHVGWWCASASRHTEIWRWWNGAQWSQPAYSHHARGLAASYAAIAESTPICHIKWCDYWPENARVPRIDPRERLDRSAP